ncbi:hypothetical protein ACFPOE_05665 [Caenimonas terrae]|uniref:Uncharacterized protein n=1 Tax=Caenimonas terrae TaxID=696074 RepID=A0ABW0ND92_9BURK
MKPIRPTGRVLAIVLVAAMVVCAWLGPLEAAANRRIDAGLQRALVSFAVARTLNAIISVAQGTEVSLQPLGVGVNLTVGQVLDPVNDVIETFSTLMLVASVAFGIEKVLVAIGAHWAVSLVLTGVALAWALLAARRLRSPPWLAQALVVLLMLRFALPLATIGSDLLFQQFLARDYAASEQVLDRTATQVDRDSPATAPAQSQGLVDRIKSWAGAQGTAWKEGFERLKQAAEQATEHVIRLMVIFILQTLVLPLAMLWGLFALARTVLRRAPQER